MSEGTPGARLGRAPDIIRATAWRDWRDGCLGMQGMFIRC